MNVNEIVRIVPTLKVNIELNEDFTLETLGMTLEESAFISLGDQTATEDDFREAPSSMRTRRLRRKPPKKLARLMIRFRESF